VNSPQGSNPNGPKGKAGQPPKNGPPLYSGRNPTPPAAGRVRHPVPRAIDPADVLINQIIDLEAEGQLHEAKAIYAESCSHDHDFEDRYTATREPLALMRVDLMPRGMDLSSQIIERVESHRPYLPRQHRRRIGGTRMLVGSAVFAIFTIGAILQISIDPGDTDSPLAPLTSSTNSKSISHASAPSNAGVSDVVSALSKKMPSVVSGIAENFEHTQIGLKNQFSLGNTALQYEGSTYTKSTDFIASSTLTSFDSTFATHIPRSSPHHQIASGQLSSHPARLSLLTSNTSATFLPSISGTFGLPAHICERCGVLDCFQNVNSSLAGHGLLGTMNLPSMRILDLDEDAAKKNRPSHSAQPDR